MSLYNLKSADGNWRVTKFTNDLEVESSYITSLSECDCPAGSRPTCRHRQMLPKMLEVGAEDSPMFYDFDKDQFFEPLVSEANESSGTVLESTFPVPPATPSDENLAEPVVLHNVEATPSVPTDAVHPTIGHIKRRI